MTHAELRELQSLQYEILDFTDEICRKYNIEYMLMYGTLLGAVRHKGVIPWDFDIDIAMTRENHNKFVETLKNLSKEETKGRDFKLWHVCYSSIDYAGLTRLIKYHEKFKNVCIDIFILDHAKLRSLKMARIQELITRILYLSKLSKQEKNILLTHFKGNLLKQSLIRLSKVSNFILGGSSNIEKLSFKLRVSKKPTGKLLIADNGRLYDKSLFLPTDEMKYEDKQYMVPAQSCQLLSDWYGDFMKYPQEGLKWLEEERLCKQ